MSISDDKRELLKLKQGLIEESEIIKEEKPPIIELHGKAKIENFFYHYKIHLLFAAFITVLLALFAYDFLGREKMDIRVLVITNTPGLSTTLYLKQDAIEEAFEAYCEDYNGNGKVHVDTYFIDIYQDSTSNADTVMANTTKLFGEIQAGTSQLIMGNKSMFYSVFGEDLDEANVLIDISQIYPDNLNIEDKYFFKVKGSNYATTALWEASCPEDMYIAVRNKVNNDEKASLTETREHSLQILEKIITSVLE